MEGAGAARLYPVVGWGKTSHVPANSWSGRDLRWGKARGWRRPTPYHPAPLGSVRSVRAGPGMLPASSGERGRPLPSVAHGAVSPFTALSPASALERRDSGMKTFVTPGYRCRRLRALLLPLRLLRSGARGPCWVKVLPLLAPLPCRAAPSIFPGKRREATGPVPEQVLPMQA